MTEHQSYDQTILSNRFLWSLARTDKNKTRGKILVMHVNKKCRFLYLGSVLRSYERSKTFL